MAMFGRLVALAKSPRGRRLLSQAQKAARDPQNRERIEEVRARFRNGKAAPAKAGVDRGGEQEGEKGRATESRGEPRAGGAGAPRALPRVA